MSALTTRLAPRIPVGTPQHFRWLKGIVVTVILMNVIDASMTITWVEAGLATEANPMMEVLLSTHPVLFMMTKLALVFLGITLLWRHRERPMAVVAIFILFMVYYGVMLIHSLGLGFGLAHWLV